MNGREWQLNKALPIDVKVPAAWLYKQSRVSWWSKDYSFLQGSSRKVANPFSRFTQIDLGWDHRRGHDTRRWWEGSILHTWHHLFMPFQEKVDNGSHTSARTIGYIRAAAVSVMACSELTMTRCSQVRILILGYLLDEHNRDHYKFKFDTEEVVPACCGTSHCSSTNKTSPSVSLFEMFVSPAKFLVPYVMEIMGCE